MLTEHTNTVYNCGNCQHPVYFRRDRVWCHLGAVTTCPGVDPLPVRLTIPMRRDAQ